jgi:metalloprotein, YbeY/UPF0054 family
MKKKASPLLALTIQRATEHTIPTRRTLRRWVLAALTARRIQHAEITLRFVDRDEGYALNHEFRGKDYATNVLTFVYEQQPKRCIGDIVLCMPVVLEEAGEKPWRTHCAHLVVHGVLHLLGFDHEKNKDAEKMEAQETAILAHLGYPDPYL